MARFAIYHRQGRTADYTITLYLADGSTAFNLASGDRVLIRIGRNSESPDLEIDSETDTANGSGASFTAGQNTVNVTLAEGDAEDLRTGANDADIIVVDASEASNHRERYAQDGMVFIHPNMADS